MKRCPECRRDYFDDSLQYCLDDGSALLEGPAAGSEVATVTLKSGDVASEVPTARHFDRKKNETVPPVTGADTTGRFYNTKGLKAAAFTSGAAILIAVACLLFYRAQFSSKDSPIRSLAVLPLRTIQPGDEYLGLGIADAIIRRISQTGQLTVRPTSSIRRYSAEEKSSIDAARELSADAVLEGTVQRSGNRLRISVNLLRVQDEESLWADNFDLRAEDIFATQDAVAQQVASRLLLRFGAQQQAGWRKHSTADPLAYDYYVRGIHSFDLRGLSALSKPQAETTISFFQKAVELDPNFGLAHAQLANVYVWTGLFIDPGEPNWFQLAKEEIALADRIDPELAETRIAKSSLLTSPGEGWQYEAATRELLAAQHIDPMLAHTNLGDIYYHIGLVDPAAREFDRALEIDPTSIWTKTDIRYFYNNMREFDLYLTFTQKYFPDEPIWTSYYNGKGLLAEARKSSDAEIQGGPDSGYEWGDRAILYALEGNYKGAEDLIARVSAHLDRKNLTYHHRTYQLACIYALIGKASESVKWLRETAETGFACYPLFVKDRYLDRVRSDREFVRFMDEMKTLNERYRGEFDMQSSK